MGKINVGRVILGGLLTGLILNITDFILNNLILGKQWAAATQALNLSPMGGGTTVSFIVLDFLVGILIIWIYAGVRPRFSPGPRTAVIVGLTVWLLYWVLGFGSTAILGLFPTKLILISLIWALFVVPIATVIGAWPYKEE